MWYTGRWHLRHTANICSLKTYDKIVYNILETYIRLKQVVELLYNAPYKSAIQSLKTMNGGERPFRLGQDMNLEPVSLQPNTLAATTTASHNNEAENFAEHIGISFKEKQK